MHKTLKYWDRVGVYTLCIRFHFVRVNLCRSYIHGARIYIYIYKTHNIVYTGHSHYNILRAVFVSASNRSFMINFVHRWFIAFDLPFPSSTLCIGASETRWYRRRLIYASRARRSCIRYTFTLTRIWCVPTHILRSYGICYIIGTNQTTTKRKSYKRLSFYIYNLGLNLTSSGTAVFIYIL